MNNIYVGILLSLLFVCLSYCLSVTLVSVSVLCLIVPCLLLLKNDYVPYSHHVATHVAWLYHKTCEIYFNLENMYSKRDISTNDHFREQSQNNGTISDNLDKISLRYQSASHNLGSPNLLKTRPSPMNTNSWITNNKVNLGHFYQVSSPQNAIVNITSLSRPENSHKDESIDAGRQYANSSISIGTSAHTPNKFRSNDSHSNDCSSEDMLRTNKSTKALDARLYANVNSPGFCSRVAEHLSETMTHQPKYDTVGAFPVVHLNSNPSKIKIKKPVRVRLTPRTNDLSYSSVGTSSRSPLNGTDVSMKSVLQVLKEISRKRIHSNVEEDNEDLTKRLRVNDVQYNSDGVFHTTLLQQTIQGKRAREETSPTEDDVKKRRKPLKNNEILSSLSSSLSIKPPHLKTTKRKAPDIDDSISTTPTGKQIKIQTEVTPPLPNTTVIASDSSMNQECEMRDVSHSPRSQSVEEAKKIQLFTEESKSASSIVTSFSENDNDKVVSRLLGRMSSPVEDTCILDVPSKKNVFMSTNDLSLSPPKENRLAAMIAVLGGPSEQLDGGSTDSEIMNQPERNLTAKALFMSPATPETPKQQKKVTFANTLTETKVFDIDNFASNENVNKGQTTINSMPFCNVNYGLSAFSQATTEQAKLSLDSKTPVNLETSSTPSASSLATQISPKSTKSSINNSSPNLSFLPNTPQSEKVPSAFSFGAVGTPEQIKEKTPQLPSSNSTDTKPISFGSNFKIISPSVSTGFGSQSLLVKTTAENNSPKSTAAKYNLFSNENASTNSKIEVNNVNKEVKNNQLVNGFSPSTAPVSTSPFSFSASVSKDSSTKPLFPSLSQQSNGPLQSTATFNFGSTTKSISSALQPSQSSNMFSSATNNQLQSSPFNKVTNESSQLSTVIKTGEIGNIFNAKSTSDQNVVSSQSISFASSAFGTPRNDSKVQSSTVQTNNLFGNVSNTTSNNTVQTNNLFGNNSNTTTSNNTVQTNNLFGNNSNTTTPNNTVQTNNLFGNNSNTTTSSSTMQTSNLFGNSSNTTSSKLSMVPGTTSLSPSQSSLRFPAISTTAQTNVGIFGLASNSIASQSNSMFGNSTTATKSSTVIGSATSANTSAQIGSLFSTSTANSTQSSIFSSSGGNQAPKSIFSSSTTTPSFGTQIKASAPIFGNQSGPNSTSTENQSNNVPSLIGSQTINSSFGNQNNTNKFNFGNKDTPNITHRGFGPSGTFNLGSSSSSSSEVKPPTFNSSTFMFGSTTTTANTEVGKPFAPAPQFSFGSNSKQTNQTMHTPAQPTLFGTSGPGFGTGQQIPTFSAGVAQSSSSAFSSGLTQPATPNFSAGSSQPAAPTFNAGVTQPAVPTFGTGMSQPTAPAFGTGMSQPAAPAFGTGMSQPTAPAFGAGISQPAAPAFGTGISQPAGSAFGAGISQSAAPAFSSGLSQPAAPAFGVVMPQPSTGGFAFGQQSSAGPTFQFNAAPPQPVQGGMFSIGSGGGSAPRSKTGALRRRHKLT